MSTSIVLDSLVKNPQGILVGFTVTNIGANDQVFYIIDDTEDSTIDQFSASITSNVKNSIGESTGGKVYFDAPYSAFNVVNDRIYEVQVYVQKYNPSSTIFSTNVRSFQKKSPLVTPQVLSYVGLDSFVLVDLSNNGFRVNSDEVSFTVKNTTHTHEEQTKEVKFDLLSHASNTFKIDLTYNFDKYEIFCKTIDNADARTSEISNTIEVYSINSSHPAVPVNESIAANGELCQITTTLTFTNDWETGHDNYSTIRVFVYDSSTATVPFKTHDISTNDIKTAGLSYDIVTNVAPASKYDLHYSTKNINRPNSFESTKETLGSYWYAFDPTPNEVTNVQLVNQDEEQLGLTFTGFTNADATSNGFILQNYVVELIDSNDNLIYSQDVAQTDTITSYSIVLNNSNGVRAGVVYKCRVKVKYTTFHEDPANDTIHYSSIFSNTRMAYKMIDDFLELTNNKITTDGQNIKLELIGSDGSNGIFPLNYNIELMYKNTDGDFVNVVDPNNSELNDNNLNRFVDASTLGNQHLIYNYTFDMLDHEEDSSNFTSQTIIRYNNFNEDTIGTEYSFKIITQYRDNDNNVLSQKLITNYNSSGFSVKTYDIAPTYSGSVSITQVNNESASISWTRKTEEPAGLTFRRYIVNLFDEDNVLQDTSGNQNETDSSKFYLYNNENAIFSHLTNGTNYYVKVAVQYQTTLDGYTSLVTLDTPFNVSETMLPYEDDLSGDNRYRVQSVTVNGFTNNSNTDNNFNVSWVVDKNALENNLDSIGLVFRKYRLRLVRADDILNIASEKFIENNIDANSYEFTNIPYNNNGYKCTVTLFFNPQEDNAARSSVNGDTVISSNLLIPYDKDVSSDNNFSVTSVTIDNFNNVLDANTINVSWNVDHVYLAGQINDYGLNFVYYKVDLIDSVTGNIAYFTTKSVITDKTHTFTNVAFNNNGYKCNVTGYYTPKETTVSDNIIGASVSNDVTLIPYNISIAGETVYEVTDVVFPTLDNQNISIQFTLPVNLYDELSNVGLNFSYYKVDLINQGVDDSKNQTFNIIDINNNTHTFSNVVFNNDGYKCQVTTVVNPKDVNNNNIISSSSVSSSRTVIPFDNLISDDNNFQASNILIPTLNNQSISISFNVSSTLENRLSNVGLDFSHYKVELINQGVDTDKNETFDIEAIGTTTHTFHDVAYNNDGYRCQVTCVFKPKDSTSSSQSIVSASVLSVRVVKPFDNDVSTEDKFKVTNVEFNNLNNQTLTIGFNLPLNLYDELFAVGLDFRHYKIDLVSQTDSSIYKTFNIENITTNSHIFTDVSYNNNGYKCHVTADYKPRDVDSSSNSILSETVISTRTVKPYDNIVSDDINFTLINPSIDDFENVDISNSINVSWQKPASLGTTMSDKGLQFKHYYLELIDNADESVVNTHIETIFTQFSYTFTNVAFNNSGYRFRVSAYYKPLDSVSLLANTEVIGDAIEDSRVLIPYNKDLTNEGQYDADTIEITSFNNNLVNTFNVNWTVPANLATTINAVGLKFKQYVVELYLSGSPNVAVDTKIVNTSIGSNSTSFTNVAYNNTGYKVKVTVFYNPLDAESAAQEIISDTLHNTRAALIPYDQVVNDDINFTLINPSMDSFENVDISNSINVSWQKPASLGTTMSDKGLQFKHYYLELIDNADESVVNTHIETIFTQFSYTFTNVAFNNSGYRFRVSAYYKPLDSVSLLANTEVIGDAIEDSRVLIPYNKDLTNEGQYDADTIEITSFNNNLVNTFNVNWTVPANLATTINAVGLKFKQYVVELYLSGSPNVAVDTKIVNTSIGSNSTSFTNVAYNNTGYKVKVTVFYNPLDAESAAQEIISDTLHNTRAALIPYDQVVNDDSNYNVTSVSIDSFNNIGTDHSVVVSWNVDTTELLNRLNSNGLNFSKYLVDLIDKDDDSVAKSINIESIGSLTNTFTDVTYNTLGYTCQVTGYYIPKDSVVSTPVQSATIVSTRTLIPYDKVVNDDDTNFAVQSVQFTSFDNVNSVKNSINVSWTVPINLANNIQNVGLDFKHYFVELISTDDSSIVSDTVTSIGLLTYQFNDVLYNTNGYQFRATAVFKPRDISDSSVEVSSTPIITEGRSLILYDKEITAEDFVITYETNESKQLSVFWNTASNLNGVGLDIKYYIVKLYSSSNVELASETLTLQTATFNGLSINNNSHYAEVSVIYKPRDAIFANSIEVTGGFHSEILNKVNIFDVTADVTEIISMELSQSLATSTTCSFTALWTLPAYEENNLFFHTIDIELLKTNKLQQTSVDASYTIDEPYTSIPFSNIPYSFGDHFTIRMRLTLQNSTGTLYVGDYEKTSSKIYPQIETTLITNHNVGLTLTETTNDITSAVNMSWVNQSQYIGNYEFDKYNIIVHNNTDNVEVYNVNETTLTNISYNALNITNGKSYNFSVSTYYKSFFDPSDNINVMDPVVVSYNANTDNTVVIDLTFLSLDISLNTDTITFNIIPNGHEITKIQYLAVPSDILSEDNYTDANDSTTFKLVITEDISTLNNFGTIAHSYNFNSTDHGWNNVQGIRLAVVNLYSNTTIVGSEINVLQ